MTIFERIYMTITMLQDRREQGEEGASMVEYALLVAGMAIVVAAATVALGNKITAFITAIKF